MMKKYCEYCEEVVEVADEGSPCPICGCSSDLTPMDVCEICGEEFRSDLSQRFCEECFSKIVTLDNVSEYSRVDISNDEIAEYAGGCSPFLMWAFRNELEYILTKEWEKLPTSEQGELMWDFLNGNEYDFSERIDLINE